MSILLSMAVHIFGGPRKRYSAGPRHVPQPPRRPSTRSPQIDVLWPRTAPKLSEKPGGGWRVAIGGDRLRPAPSVGRHRVSVASEMSGEMVYYNPLMYRGHSQQNPSYPGWYPPGYHQPQQQFLSCMHDAAEQQWSHHHFSPAEWPVEPEPVLPSPSVTVQSTSGGSELSSPGLPQNPRPPPARSPYEWMRKPSYQSQPNPG
ncbi:hypothetical protein J6590_044175 [Homalodisca vitripennis]|nr:hypothetical protein J6590_044175 [Homalodisca vitripennis]